MTKSAKNPITGADRTHCLSSGERARKAASRLALTLATMRVEFELMHAELETLTGRLNHWVEDGASGARHG